MGLQDSKTNDDAISLLRIGVVLHYTYQAALLDLDLRDGLGGLKLLEFGRDISLQHQLGAQCVRTFVLHSSSQAVVELRYDYTDEEVVNGVGILGEIDSSHTV